MARCEDFPCCGHELNGCPSEDGTYPCCICYGPLPKNARSSICVSCQKRQMRRDYDERDGYFWGDGQ